MPPDVSILALASLAATGNAARDIGHMAIGNLLHLDVGRSESLGSFLGIHGVPSQWSANVCFCGRDPRGKKRAPNGQKRG
jgi:hypothetical protein